MLFRESKFYGRQYKIYEQIDPLTEKQIEFDKIVYLKNFISTNNLNKANLSKKLIDNLYKAEKSYRKLLIKTDENTNNSTMTVYFNILSMINFDDYGILSKESEIDYSEKEESFNPSFDQKNNLEKLKCIFKGFVFNNTLFKFKDLYVKFLYNYNEVLKLDGIFNNHKDNSEEILLNLLSLSAVRVLTDKEQEYIKYT